MDKWQAERRTQQLSTGLGAHGLFAILPRPILHSASPQPILLVLLLSIFVYTAIAQYHQSHVHFRRLYNMHNTHNNNTITPSIGRS